MSAVQAQVFDPSASSGISASEVVGYYPTEVSEQNYAIEPTLQSELPPGGEHALANSAEFDWYEGSAWEGWSDVANRFLSPLIPGEALARQNTTYGSFSESFRLGLPISLTRTRPRVDLLLGPLALDFTSIGTVALYSDVTGPGKDRFEDDGFLGAITFKTALYLQITDAAALRLHASLYYLYTENEFGFYMNSGDSTVAEFAFRTRLGNWDVKLSDVFRVYYPISDFLDDVQVDEIAVSGRYRLGRADFVDSNPFNSENMYFLNTIRLEAATWLSDNLRLKLHASHWDLWKSDDFIKQTEVNNLGAGLFYDSPDIWFMPWFAYDWYDFNDSQMTINYARVGVTLPFTRTFNAYLRGGYFSTETDTGRTLERPTWDIGLVHHINRELSHSLFAGNSFFIDEIGDPFMGSYWRYTVRWAPGGPRFAISSYIQNNSNDLSDLEAWFYGLKVDLGLSARTRLSIVAGITESSQTGGFNYTSHIARVTLMRYLTRRLRASLSCQMATYDLAGSEADFDELFIMLDLQWTL